MKQGIILDDWKLPIFRRRLEEAGIEYTDGGSPLPNITLLHVLSEDMVAVGAVVAASTAECEEKSRG